MPDPHAPAEPEDAAPSAASPAPGEPDDPAEPADGAPSDDEAAAAIALAEDQLRRALADLDNLRKRYEREVGRERSQERARVVREVLPVVDDLERAVQHAEADPAATLAGLKVVLDRVVAMLERLGYPRFEDVGARFDPARHEALGVVDSDAPAGSVVRTVRPGYGTSEEVLRPAGVVVAREPG